MLGKGVGTVVGFELRLTVQGAVATGAGGDHNARMRFLVDTLEVLVLHVLLVAHRCNGDADGLAESAVSTLRVVRETKLAFVFGRGWCPSPAPLLVTLPISRIIALDANLVLEICLVTASGPSFDNDMLHYHLIVYRYFM